MAKAPQQICSAVILILGAAVFLPPATPAQTATFGTTVVSSSGFRGQIYKLHRWASHLPKFAKMKPIGSVYTTSLNVPTQNFDRGFPGVTGRFEFFAIDYQARFWIEHPGLYVFRLRSDDGADLRIDDRLIIDNDGLHPPQEKDGTVDLSRGIHVIRVSYFQGPRYQVALVLRVRSSTRNRFQIFDTRNFEPPAGVSENPEK